MRYKTAFRLGLKLIGAWLFVTAVTDLIQYVGVMINFYSTLNPAYRSNQTWMDAGYLLGAGSKICLALYLFFGGKWIANMAVPSNRPYCHECGYELRGLGPSGVCPECGTEFHQQRGSSGREIPKSPSDSTD